VKKLVGELSGEGGEVKGQGWPCYVLSTWGGGREYWGVREHE